MIQNPDREGYRGADDGSSLTKAGNSVLYGCQEGQVGSVGATCDNESVAHYASGGGETVPVPSPQWSVPSDARTPTAMTLPDKLRLIIARLTHTMVAITRAAHGEATRHTVSRCFWDHLPSCVRCTGEPRNSKSR